MTAKSPDSAVVDSVSGRLFVAELHRQQALLNTGALQDAILKSANFSSIATDAKGVIQIFNVGAERMLGYTAADVVNKITPADISDPQEVIARAKALSLELGTAIAPGFEAMVFKASRGIEDIYELTYFRKDGSRFPAVVSVTALRDARDAIIGYLLIGTDNTARKQVEEKLRWTEKDNQEKLLSYGRGLESIISERTAELAYEKQNLEASVAERTAQLNLANEELTKQAAELSKRNEEITLFSRMNDFLQTSTTEAEAYSIISETATQLFLEDSGGVFVLNSSRSMLEAAAVWGPLPPSNPIFPPAECWALRRGQIHVAIDRERWCPHVTDDGHMYVCLPLLAQGETLGILHLLDGTGKHGKADEARMAEKCKLAKILADNIGLGIANLKLRESMRSLSIRDPLTGLFNRRYMEEVLAQEQHRSLRNKEQLAVIMIDIDYFKKFNDDYGHDGGDSVLRALGGFFTAHVRGSDIACRYGGEEFILILSPSTGEGALQRAEKIREGAKLLSLNHANRNLGAITLSMGLALYPNHAPDDAALIRAADLALYQAKRDGRNRVVMFTDQAAQADAPTSSAFTRA